MPAPNYIPDPINKLRASATWNGFPGLNIVPEYLTADAFDISFNGDFSTPLPALTGVVQSIEAYVAVDVTAHLIVSSPLANAYKLQYESSALLGAVTIRPVTNNLSPFNFTNMSIRRASPMSMSGRDPAFVLVMSGSYNVNSAQWP